MQKQILDKASRGLLVLALVGALTPLNWAQTVDCRPRSKYDWAVSFLLAAALKSPEMLDAPARCQPAQQESQPKPAEEAQKNKTSAEQSDPREFLPELPAREVMKHARILHFKARSSFYSPEKLERELLKRQDFSDMGLEITRAEKYADLVLEVTRKKLTTRFTCTMIEPHSKRIVAAVTASSLGGEIEPNLAEVVIKQFQAARLSVKKP